MDLLKMLNAEHEKLQKRSHAVLQAINALKIATGAAGKAYVKSLSKPKRKLSAAARKRISLAQKARWAKRRQIINSRKKVPAHRAA
jgi:hypothetical protein